MDYRRQASRLKAWGTNHVPHVVLSLCAIIGLMLPLWAPTTGLRQGKTLAFAYIGLIILLVSLADNWPMRLFGVVVPITFLYHNDFGATIALIMIIIGFGLYRLSSVMFRDRFGLLLNFLCMFIILQTAYQVIQFFELDPLFKAVAGHGGKELNNGWTGNTNVIGNIQAFGLFAFLRPKWSWFIPLVVIGLCISGCSTSALAVGFALLVYIVSRFVMQGDQEITPGAFVMLASMLAAIIFQHYDVFRNPRWHVWTIGATYLQALPWFGYGLGSFADAFAGIGPIDGTLWRQAHNEYYQALFELGPVALLAALGFVWVKMRRQTDHIKLAMMAALTISSIGFFTFHAPDYAIWAIIFLGAI